MTDRPVRVQRLLAVQGEFDLHVSGPIKGVRPLLLLNRSPTVRQPQLGCPIALVVDKLPKLRVGDQAVGKTTAMQQFLMAWRLVVETKFCAGRASFDNTRGNLQIADRGRGATGLKLELEIRRF